MLSFSYSLPRYPVHDCLIILPFRVYLLLGNDWLCSAPNLVDDIRHLRAPRMGRSSEKAKSAAGGMADSDGDDSDFRDDKVSEVADTRAIQQRAVEIFCIHDTGYSDLNYTTLNDEYGDDYDSAVLTSGRWSPTLPPPEGVLRDPKEGPEVEIILPAASQDELDGREEYVLLL